MGIANGTYKHCYMGGTNEVGIGFRSIDDDGFTLYNTSGKSGTLYYVAVKL